MPGTILWDVDTQYDFMFSDGKLYVPDAEEILPQLARLTRWGRKQGVRMVASVDYHSLADAELSEKPDFHETFPPHCLAGSPGHDKVDATRPVDPLWIDAAAPTREAVAAHRGEVIFRKQRFDVFSNPNVELVLDVLRPDDIVVYGVALDVCDRYAIEGLLARGHKVTIVRDAVKPIYPEAGARLMTEWANRGARIANTAEIIA
jgi:nicotinamidase/pyrazinamidase